MIVRLDARPRALIGFAAATVLAFACVQLSLALAPWRSPAPVEIGNDVVATVGLIWALIQIWSNRQSETLRRAWECAASGSALLALEDHLEEVLNPLGYQQIETLISVALWTAAAYLIFACGRRYAMRRGVMSVMMAALVVEVAAQGLALAIADGASPAVETLQESGELVTVFLFVVALLLTRIAPLKDYRFAPEKLGLRGRRLQADFGLRGRPRYPTGYPLLQVPGFRHLFIVAMILWFAPRAAGAVARHGGRSVFAQIADLLRLGFVEGIDAKSYYVHELYRDPSLADETLTRVETKNGLTKALQSLRATASAERDMNDKLSFWRACERAHVPSAPIFATVEEGAAVFFQGLEAFDRSLFVKERKGRGGRFVLNFERVAPFLYRDDSGAERDLESVMAELQEHGLSRRLIIQPKLANHPSIRSLGDQALLVFRVVTCLDRRGEPHVTHGLLRILRRFEPNWPVTPDADYGCAIDLETGAFGQMTGDAPETCTDWFDNHPITGERVTGRILEGWPEIAETALAAHRLFSGRILVGWDIAWTPEGVRILEGNNNMDFSFFQRLYRTPIGRSPLAPLLNAHFDALTARAIAAAP